MWEGVGDRTELQHIDPYSYGHQYLFPVRQGCSTGGPGAQLSAGCWLSLPHLVSRLSDPQTKWLPVFTELYNSSIAHSISPHNWPSKYALSRLWNGMFDRHQEEITVMQFTGHSLPVHQFVTVPWDFNLVLYCQPSSPTPMEYALPPSLEWHVWRGRRSIYNIGLHLSKFCYSLNVPLCWNIFVMLFICRVAFLCTYLFQLRSL